MEISEIFLTFTITSFIGLVLALTRACYKSKCSNVDLCGCITIIRNTEVEEQLDIQENKKKESTEESKTQA